MKMKTNYLIELLKNKKTGTFKRQVEVGRAETMLSSYR